jgi:hypothetical protein
MCSLCLMMCNTCSFLLRVFQPGTQAWDPKWRRGVGPMTALLHDFGPGLEWAHQKYGDNVTCATNTKNVSNTSWVRQTYKKITKDTRQKYNSNNNHHNKDSMTFGRIPYTFHILFRIVFICFIFVHTLVKRNLTHLHTQAKYNPPAVNKNSKYPSGTCVLVTIRSL